MILRIFVATILLLTPAALAQRDRISINADTPEGQLLQQIGQEEDTQKKLALMEQFIGKFPKHASVGWVYAQMPSVCTKLGQFDKAMAVTEKLLALDPADAEMAHGALKAAEAKEDSDAIKKWAVLTSEAARKMVNIPKPREENEGKAWEQRVDYARQVDIYTEFALYHFGLQAADPKKRIELLETLFERNAGSKYAAMGGGPLFQLYQETGQRDKALQFAERTLQKDQSNDDMMLVMASHYYEGMKDKQKVLDYCGKLLSLLPTKPKPEGVGDADWRKTRDKKMGLANWMSGVVYSTGQEWAQADKTLRAALPNIRDTVDLLAEALFHLGVSNFKLGEPAGDQQRILDAMRFNQECAAIPGRYQEMAKKNIAAIQNQYRIK